MKELLKNWWPVPATIVILACMIVPAIRSVLKQDAIIFQRKIKSAELQLLAVHNGLGEFYVSTNTATIEFRLKEKP